jgi:N-acetylneuraminate lyase
MLPKKTAGLIAAPFTPMHPDGALNLEAIAPYGLHLQRFGVVGAFICGTTGEGSSLTLAERRQVAERWRETAPAGLRVIVHVGHTCLADARELAAHAQAIGADSIACLAPFFFKPEGVAGLVDWCAQVAAAAPKLPFYYYHMPSMTGCQVPVADFLAAAGPRMPSLAGIKFTFEDIGDFARCLRCADGRYDVLFGRDELLHSALKLGARGAVGSTYNFAAPLYRQLIAAYDQGDEATATALQRTAVDMIQACVQAGGHPIANFKTLLRPLGVDCGPARPPLRNPTAEQGAALHARLENAGILPWVARSLAAAPAAR